MKWCHETVRAESDHQMRELTGFLVEILDTWSLCHYRFTVPEDDETQWLVVLIAKKKILCWLQKLQLVVSQGSTTNCQLFLLYLWLHSQLEALIWIVAVTQLWGFTVDVVLSSYGSNFRPAELTIWTSIFIPAYPNHRLHDVVRRWSSLSGVQHSAQWIESWGVRVPRAAICPGLEANKAVPRRRYKSLPAAAHGSASKKRCAYWWCFNMWHVFERDVDF